MPAPQIEPVFLPNQGIDLTKPEQFLSAQVSPYTRNMEFFNQRWRGRGGLAKFDNAQLSGPVLHVQQYWKFTGSYSLIAITTKDAYRYDFGNARYDILTPLYTTGTIEVQSGTETIIRGTGTSWSSSNCKVGDFIKIGSGDVHTGSTWYEITAVNFGTQQLTIASAAPVTAALTAYVLRKTFTGTASDLWTSVQFLDNALGETFIATNGVDTPHYYTGSGQFTPLTGLPAGVTTAKYLAIFYDRLVLMWTREAGANQPIRTRWSAPGDCLTYDAAHVIDLNLPDAQYWIKGSYLEGNNLIIVKEYKAYIVSKSADSTAVFDFDFLSSFEGNFSAQSVIQKGTGAYYFGYDNRFRFFNGVRDDSRFDGLFPYFINMDVNGCELIVGYQVEGRKQLRWVLPYDAAAEVSPMLVYDYGEDVATLWEYELTSSQKIRCIGEYLAVSDLYVDDPAWANLYVDEEAGYWDDRTFLSNAPQIIYGCEDGYLRKADFGSTDDGAAFQRTLRLKKLDFRIPQYNKRLMEQEYWLEAQTTGTLTVRVKRNDSNSFEPATKTINLVDAARNPIKKRVRWDKEAENFQFELTATSHWEMIGVLNYFFAKNMRVS